MIDDSTIEAYLAAWSDGDPDAVAAACASFTDPDTGGPVSGTALAGHAAVFLARFPGKFEFERHGPVLTWRLTAAHRGAYLGIPATGGEIVVDGVDVLTPTAGGVVVRRSFDRLAVAEALGQSPRFVPADTQGETAFGVSSRTPGRPGEPGALTLTWLEVRDDAESAEVDLLSVEIVKSLRASSGFLGAATLDIGSRKYTLSAFDRPESVRAVHARPHQRAMRKFFRGGLCTGAYTGVWAPVRESHYGRCPDCAAMTAAGTACDCGRRPEAQPLF
ncbi:nuclear transport factor 2 family protein [Pseudonocardia nematodicida]|uniref:Nuclear transport factor 2 family protein n=1 Tax=Pseudonocardia nematodicida TaxID=1206997 RepID=A0ABV1K6S1_9PSEU